MKPFEFHIITQCSVLLEAKPCKQNADALPFSPFNIVTSLHDKTKLTNKGILEWSSEQEITLRDRCGKITEAVDTKRVYPFIHETNMVRGAARAQAIYVHCYRARATVMCSAIMTNTLRRFLIDRYHNPCKNMHYY